MCKDATSIKKQAGVIRALEADDMSGFDEIYSKHYRRVYSICLRMTGNVVESEDLTQEVFLQLHRKIKSFRGESPFTTWLHRLTVNHVLMHFRKHRVHSEVSMDDGEKPDQTSDNPRVMLIVDQIALDSAIAQLPKGYRVVFILHDVEGYEHEEVAKILGIHPGTSKSQLHKARLRLRKLLLERIN